MLSTVCTNHYKLLDRHKTWAKSNWFIEICSSSRLFFSRPHIQEEAVMILADEIERLLSETQWLRIIIVKAQIIIVLNLEVSKSHIAAWLIQ